jgi:integrase
MPKKGEVDLQKAKLESHIGSPPMNTSTAMILTPIGPMSWQSVSGRAVHYLRLAGIDIPRRGSHTHTHTHTLRHTCVQRLVDAEFSLKQIGDYVGHGSPDTTRIYAKVDFESLRELAVGLGEGAPLSCAFQPVCISIF